MTIRKSTKHPCCFFFKPASGSVLLKYVTRPIQRIIWGTNGWFTVVCKWSSDRDWIMQEVQR